MFVDLSNYVGIDQDSEHALERMTRDIRKSRTWSASPRTASSSSYDGTTRLSFTYDPAARQLVRSMTGEADTCLMKDCDFLEFSMYKTLLWRAERSAQTTDARPGQMHPGRPGMLAGPCSADPSQRKHRTSPDRDPQQTCIMKISIAQKQKIQGSVLLVTLGICTILGILMAGYLSSGQHAPPRRGPLGRSGSRASSSPKPASRKRWRT